MIQFKNVTENGKRFGIYQIRNTLNDFVYIGQTKESYLRRYWLHNFLLKNKKHDNVNLQNDYNKYGEKYFIFEPLIIVSDKNIDLDSLEIECIKKARETEQCYNISDGGKGAKGVRMTEVNKKYHTEHNRILNTGKKASEETKKKMSIAHKNNPPSKEQIALMRKAKEEKYLNGMKDKHTKITANDAKEIKIALMNNISYDDLAEEFGISRSNINAIRSNRSWKFVEVDGWDEYCQRNKGNNQARQSRSAT